MHLRPLDIALIIFLLDFCDFLLVVNRQLALLITIEPRLDGLVVQDARSEEVRLGTEKLYWEMVDQCVCVRANDDNYYLTVNPICVNVHSASLVLDKGLTAQGTCLLESAFDRLLVVVEVEVASVICGAPMMQELVAALFRMLA